MELLKAAVLLRKLITSKASASKLLKSDRDNVLTREQLESDRDDVSTQEPLKSRRDDVSTLELLESDPDGFLTQEQLKSDRDADHKVLILIIYFNRYLEKW